MNSPLAETAFNVRFRRELASAWEKLQSATIEPLSIASPDAKEAVLRKFFEDAAEQIAAVVHSYFPRLLGATTNRARTGVWIASKIRELTCDFLRINTDENVKNQATPPEEGRITEAARLMLYCTGWRPTTSTDEFLLPWWADRHLLYGYRFGPGFVVSPELVDLMAHSQFSPPSGDDGECMTPADTLAWIKEREVEIRARLELQIENEILDSMIVSDSIPQPLSSKQTPRRRSGPKPRPRTQVLREILSKKSELSCEAVCRLMDSKFAANYSQYPTLSRPEFGGRTYDSWVKAYSDRSARNLVESLISRCRPKAT